MEFREKILTLHSEISWLKAEGIDTYLEDDHVLAEGIRLRFKIYPDDNDYRIRHLCMKIATPSNYQGAVVKSQLVCFDETHHNYSEIRIEELIEIAEKLGLLVIPTETLSADDPMYLHNINNYSEEYKLDERYISDNLEEVKYLTEHGLRKDTE